MDDTVVWQMSMQHPRIVKLIGAGALLLCPLRVTFAALVSDTSVARQIAVRQAPLLSYSVVKLSFRIWAHADQDSHMLCQGSCQIPETPVCRPSYSLCKNSWYMPV